MGPVATRTVQTRCTNWDAFGLVQIWEMLAHEDGRLSWEQVAAWNRMKSLCTFQAARLRNAALELASLWPPDASDAARLFQSVVLNMVGSLEEDATAAGVNANVLSRLTENVATARQQILHLMDQLQERQAEQQERQRDRIPGMPYGGLFASQRNELDKAARNVMQKADVDLAMAVADFRVSTPYLPPDSTKEEPGAAGDSGGSAGVAGFSGSTFPGVPSPPPPSIAHVPTPGVPPVSELTNERDEGGQPALTGSNASEGLHPSAGGPLATAHDPTSIGTAFTAQALSTPDVRTSPMIGPGGIIRPPQGTRPSDMTAPRPVPGRSSAPAGTSTGMMPPMVPPARSATGRSAVSPAKTRRRSSDSNDPWIPKGVPPVIEPVDDPITHDPGPGVIGIDR
jgi:hypothetical protein